MIATSLGLSRDRAAPVQPCCGGHSTVRARPAAVAVASATPTVRATNGYKAPEHSLSTNGSSTLDARVAAQEHRRCVLKPVQWEREDRARPYSILAIDGGGMRGMIPACVLEQVEHIIKEEALDLLKKSCENGSLKDFTDVLHVYDLKGNELQTQDQLEGLKLQDLNVDLADFFDLISGTSTGAILASYLATKGGASGPTFLNPTDPSIADSYKGPLDEFLSKHNADMFNPMGKDKSAELRAGSAVGAQALFRLAGTQIFAKPRWYPFPRPCDICQTQVASFLAACTTRLDQTVMLVRSLYSQNGISNMLKGVLFNPSTNKDIMLSDRECLHTSLLIPSFQIEHNRPVMFWHLHQPEGNQPTSEAVMPQGSSFGYSTLNRLRPFKELKPKIIDSAAMVKKIVIAMSQQLHMKLEDVEVADTFDVSCSNDRFVCLVTQKVMDLKSGTDLEDVKEDDIKKVVKGALQLLSAVKEGNRWAKQYLQECTFKRALEAMIKPGLRPDMKTTMYVFTPDAPANSEATQTLPWSARATRVRMIQAPGNLLMLGGGTYGAGPSGGNMGAVQGPAHLVRQPPNIQPPSFQLPSGPQWPSWAREAKNEQGAKPESVRFYEAQSGDSLHMYNVDFKLWEVVRASTAAPTYFPAAEVTSQGVAGIGEKPKPMVFGKGREPLLYGHFADGGVVANNPTLAAIAFAERAYGVDNSKIAVLSLGCGSVVDGIKINPKAGAARWGLPLVGKVFMGSSIDTATALAEMVFTVCSTPSPAEASRYLRIQAVGFAPPGKGAKGGSPVLQIQKPDATTDINEVRKDVNYLAIDPTDALRVSGPYTNEELCKALEHMDRPEDWDKLRAIGTALGDHFKEDIRAWVKHHILDPKAESACGDHCSHPRRGQSERRRWGQRTNQKQWQGSSSSGSSDCSCTGRRQQLGLKLASQAAKDH